MLENPAPATQPDSTTTAVKRYAPPNQRNRSLNRRKSGDRFDRSNSLYANDAEKNQQHAPSRNIPVVVDHGDIGSSNLLNENSRPQLIALDGCCRSEASHLLNDRWELAMRKYNDISIDLSERPVMYSGSSAPWGALRLPHQFMSATNTGGGPTSGSQMDFLSDLRRAIRNAGTNSCNSVTST